jgi:hypothetical protein
MLTLTLERGLSSSSAIKPVIVAEGFFCDIDRKE